MFDEGVEKVRLNDDVAMRAPYLLEVRIAEADGHITKFVAQFYLKGLNRLAAARGRSRAVVWFQARRHGISLAGSRCHKVLLVTTAT